MIKLDNIHKIAVELLAKYIESECHVISETSGNFREDYTKLQNKVKDYCTALGLEYKDSLFHEHVIDCINDYEY